MTNTLEVDVTGLVRSWLASHTAARMVTELPADLAAQLPLGRVVRTGGPDDGFALDVAVIVCHWFAASDTAARALAYAGCTALRRMVGPVIGGATVTRVRKMGGPFQADYENPAVRRQITTHELYVKAAS